jgi:uncharacterized protein (TIGR02453 family)
MSFEGFPDAALLFYEGLEADNSKAYWTDNKATYESAVAEPMKALLAELEKGFGTAKLFRPYRDVRFSKDKTPYKTRQYAVVHQGDQGLYVGIDAEGLHLGGGMFHASTEQVTRMRSAIDDESTGSALESVLTKLRKGGMQVGGDQLKRVPKPYDPEHPRADLLRHKSLIAWVDHEPAPWLHTGEAKARVTKAWKALGPLNTWLLDHT